MEKNENFTDKQKELSNCTFVKTVLMLIVVIYHCTVFWTGSWFDKEPVCAAQPLSWISRWMQSFHIYGFTLVSGYLFYFLKIEQEKYQKFGSFVANKAKRLLVPYAVVSVAWVIPVTSVFFPFDIGGTLKNYLFGLSPSQLWFLLMLFFVFVLFYPFSRFFAEHDVWGGLVALAFYGAGLVGTLCFPNVFQFFTACSYIPFFWIGFKLRQRGSELLRKIPVFIWLAIDILLFIFVEYLKRVDGRIFALLTIGFSFALRIFGALMVFFVLQKLANLVKWKGSKVFLLFSKSSMPVYLFHQQLIYFVIYWLNGVLNPYVHAMLNFVIAMTVSLVISYVLMKHKYTRRLIGEK